jgi:lipopolysaccharide transport system ATP-binding protein
MSAVVIRADNLGKRYRLGQLEPYKTLRDVITGAFTAPFRRRRSQNRSGLPSAIQHAKSEYVWVLKDVSFEIKRGEVVGIVGRNGAGKSTLLKILSRITEPTEGYAEFHGRVQSLLEVGTGFHPELTGRENIYLNAAILGMKRREIERKFDEIVAFSEIEKFLDTPVKRYSSGMYVRLAFAVAAHLEPEILLLDEVLSVGDAAFQKKCLGKMGEVAKEGRTVLFVSHNMGAIRSLCDRAILLDQGNVRLDAEPAEIIRAYLSAYISSANSGAFKAEVFWPNEAEAPGGDEVRLISIRLLSKDGRPNSTFEVDKPICVEISYRIKCPLRGMRLRLGLMTLQGELAFESTDHQFREEEAFPGIYRNLCTIPGGLLNIGAYIVRVGGGIPGVKVLLPMTEYFTFSTAGCGNQGSNYPEKWPGVVCPKLDWIIERIGEERK